LSVSVLRAEVDRAVGSAGGLKDEVWRRFRVPAPTQVPAH
jgi:hypothetical protein